MEALHAASLVGDVSKIHLALQTGVEVDSKNAQGATCLMLASAAGYVDASQVVVDDQAAWLESTQVLLEAGAAVNLRDPGGRTALIWASAIGQEGSVRVLLEAGAVVDAADENRTSALMHASQNGRADAVRVLTEAGAAMHL